MRKGEEKRGVTEDELHHHPAGDLTVKTPNSLSLKPFCHICCQQQTDDVHGMKGRGIRQRAISTAKGSEGNRDYNPSRSTFIPFCIGEDLPSLLNGLGRVSSQMPTPSPFVFLLLMEVTADFASQT